MKYTKNINLPIYDGNDKFYESELNSANEKVDKAIGDIQETINKANLPDIAVSRDIKEITSQLADIEQQKANKNEVNLKRDKSIPIGLNDAGSDLLSAIQGGTTVNVLSIPRDYSVSSRKTTFMTTGKNLFDINAIKSNFILNSSGDEVPNELNIISDYTPIKSGEKVYLAYGDNVLSFNNRIVLYNSDYTKIETLSSFASGDTITNPNVAYFRTALTKTVAENKLMIGKQPFTVYEPFYNKLSNVKVEQLNIAGLEGLNTQDKTSLVNAINEVLRNVNQSSSESKRLHGKTIVCLGDSLMALSNFPDVIAIKTGATVYNCAFGGTRLARHPVVAYDSFSLYRLVDSIIGGNWSLQETYTSIEPPYEGILNTLKGVDFQSVDYIVINHGRNDQTGDVALGDINAPEDGYRFYGALKYVIRKLQSAYPHIKLIFVTPAWSARFGMNDTAPDTNSDVVANSEGKYLYDFADAMLNVSKKYHYPCYDFYRNSGVNEFNYQYYYYDGLHLTTPQGKEHWGNKFSSFILANV